MEVGKPASVAISNITYSYSVVNETGVATIQGYTADQPQIFLPANEAVILHSPLNKVSVPFTGHFERDPSYTFIGRGEVWYLRLQSFRLVAYAQTTTDFVTFHLSDDDDDDDDDDLEQINELPFLLNNITDTFTTNPSQRQTRQ